MKLKNITLIVLIAITATLLTGCQDELKQQLTDCQQDNANLQSKLNTQQEDIAKFKKIEEGYSYTLMNAMMENEKLKKENEKLKGEIESLKPTTPTPNKAKEMTPEQKERFQKGLDELRRLQKESAEKMRQEKLKKEVKE